MSIGELNRKVTIKSWTATQDAGGGSTAVQASSYSMWANVQDRDGIQITQGQAVWKYDYKVKVRYEASRKIGSNYTIDYDSKRLKINSVSFKTEGQRKYAILRCEALDQTVASGSGGVELPVPQIATYTYTAVAQTAVITIAALSGKTIFGAFKDGIKFDIITTGVPTGKEVLIEGTTFTWSVPFEIGEKASIQYIN